MPYRDLRDYIEELTRRDLLYVIEDEISKQTIRLIKTDSKSEFLLSVSIMFSTMLIFFKLVN